ncbi:hypothetical protein GGX14DRAFT_562985 [Mycena pura]|uniref:Uncharacterized protein n=1 Tax=Mycena pura TaxID=153505 RepID=A0AAD6VNC9_9AGAR|nr:hypothetical protein GGX14DRAFT_562985 [Mycena pura]
MPKAGCKRRRTAARARKDDEDTEICRYCDQPVTMNMLQHQRVCKAKATTRRQLVKDTQDLRRKRDDILRRRQPADIEDGAPIDLNYSDIASLSNSQLLDMQIEIDNEAENDDSESVDALQTVELPPRFILVVHHPHAKKSNEIIPVDKLYTTASGPELYMKSAPFNPGDRPWRPFKSFADFKFTSRRVKRRSPNAEIDEDLLDLQDGSLSSDSKVSFRNHRDMEKSLAVARTSNVSFRCQSLTIEFDGAELGGVYEVEVEFRNPWQIMKQWVCDETLAPVSTWFSQRRYLCTNGTMDLSNPLYDEPWTAENWWAADNDLPADSFYPSCYLGFHIWLDKGLVTTKVKMHPILIRGCWIHSTTRNCSGNGGSALVGFVKMPDNMRQIDPKTLNSSVRNEYDRLKRMIYRGVCRLVMDPLRELSHRGEALRFGDGVTRVAYPGILIESMDFEEMAAWLAIKNSTSLHPCPQCLVHKDDLHRLSQSYPKR